MASHIQGLLILVGISVAITTLFIVLSVKVRSIYRNGVSMREVEMAHSGELPEHEEFDINWEIHKEQERIDGINLYRLLLGVFGATFWYMTFVHVYILFTK